MRILGVDLTRDPASAGPGEHTLVMLDSDGRIARTEQAGTLPEVAAAVGELSGGEPFLLGVNTPVVVPAKPSRARPVENLVRRRYGFKLPPGGRAALSAEPLGVAGEALIAGLAAAGMPCLSYPDRDLRKSGLAETYPGLALKVLLWETSPLAQSREPSGNDQLFKAFMTPAYRAAKLPARSSWRNQAVNLELVLRVLTGTEGFDLEPAREALHAASSTAEVERAAALLDAALIAGAVRRYISSPESSLFLGDQEGGYIILPADSFIRRLGIADSRPQDGELFPQASLRKRLGAASKVRSLELLSVPGKPQRLEATYDDKPAYEFDNVDEMMWWKHCRHISGPRLPTEGLIELVVELKLSSGEGVSSPLRLARSRHTVLSFRFDPPGAWRRHAPTRDGKTYPFNVIRAVYEAI
jgi:predicted RNase H-like nuclease